MTKTIGSQKIDEKQCEHRKPTPLLTSRPIARCIFPEHISLIRFETTNFLTKKESLFDQ